MNDKEQGIEFKAIHQMQYVELITKLTSIAQRLNEIESIIGGTKRKWRDDTDHRLDVIESKLSKPTGERKGEHHIPCQGEWHTLSYDDYAKKHGGCYPRSCPECHSCFNHEPIKPSEEPKQECNHHCTRTMKGMDIYCSNCNKKLDNELSEWGKGWHQGFKDAQNPLYNELKSTPQESPLVCLDENEVIKFLLEQERVEHMSVEFEKAQVVAECIEKARRLCAKFGTKESPCKEYTVEELVKLPEKSNGVCMCDCLQCNTNDCKYCTLEKDSKGKFPNGGLCHEWCCCDETRNNLIDEISALKLKLPVQGDK